MVEVDPTTGELVSFHSTPALSEEALPTAGNDDLNKAPARSFLRMRGGGSFNSGGACPEHAQLQMFRPDGAAMEV